MPKKIIWTDAQDAQIRRLRTEGASWDAIAAILAELAQNRGQP